MAADAASSVPVLSETEGSAEGAGADAAGVVVAAEAAAAGAAVGVEVDVLDSFDARGRLWCLEPLPEELDPSRAWEDLLEVFPSPWWRSC